MNYGNALIGSRRLDDAVRALDTAIRLDPRAANAHNNLGIALAQQQKLPQARRRSSAPCSSTLRTSTPDGIWS